MRIPRRRVAGQPGRMRELTYEVLVLDGTPRAGEQRLPSGESIVSSPLSVVLIAGEGDPFTNTDHRQI